LLLKVFGNTFSGVRMAEISDKTKTRKGRGLDHLIFQLNKLEMPRFEAPRT
jgi:hypothetical protein